MFGKLHEAKQGTTTLSIYKGKRGGDPINTIQVVWFFNFTPELAGGIGGAAPEVQQLIEDGDQGARLGDGTLHLDTKEVKVEIRSGAPKPKSKVVIAQTMSLTAKAGKPLQESASPSLRATARFAPGDINAVKFLEFFYANLGRTVNLRMDKVRPELPGTQSPGKDKK